MAKARKRGQRNYIVAEINMLPKKNYENEEIGKTKRLKEIGKAKRGEEKEEGIKRWRR